MSAIPVMTSFATSGAALIASPNSVLRERVMHRLNGRWRPVQQARGGAEALATLEKADWQVLYLDRHLPDLDTEELLPVIRRRFPNIQVVLLDSDGSTEEGDGLPSQDRFSADVLHELPASRPVLFAPLPGMIGSSAAMRRVYRMTRLVAARATTVLVSGPTGTGKELVARAIHALSPRAAKPFIVVNCAAIPETLLESELFGYSRGAFTGAVQAQIGRIAAAQGGTLFLDEVSELPLGMQAKLLRFLEQKEVQRLGSTETMRVDVRVVAASNRNLALHASKGQFRPDLFYRLSAFPIELPSLAERKEDIVPLAENFLASMAAAMDTPVQRLSTEAIRQLEAHSWQGNVRELQHVMERASILCDGESCITGEHLCFSYLCPIAPEAKSDCP